MKSYRFWLAWLPLLFPLYLVRFDFFGVPSTLLEVVVGVLAVWGLVRFVRPLDVVKWIKQQVGMGLKSPLWPMMLFFSAATISMLIVPEITINIDGDPVESARIAQGIWKGWIVMPMVYFSMLYLVRPHADEHWFKGVFTVLGLSGLILAFLAIYQMISGNYLTMDARASGPFESANYLSLYLAPILLYAILNIRKSFFWVLFAIIMGVAFAGTQSYAAFIALFVGVIFYLLMHPDIAWKKKVGGAVLGVILAGGLFATQMNTSKFQEFLNFKDRTSSSVRVEVYTVATTLLKENPIWGIGLGQFEVQYQVNAPRILGQPPYEWVMLHPHNLGMAVWANTGLLGVVAMTWILLLAFFRFKKISRFHLVILSMLVVILTHGLFDTPFFKNDLAYMWWLIVVALL